MENGDLIKRIQELEREVAELHREREVVAARETQLHVAIEMGGMGFWVWDSTDLKNPGGWSNRLKEIFGFAVSTDVTYEQFLECVHPEDRVQVETAVMKSLEGQDQGIYRMDYRFFRANDRSERWVAARGQSFFDEEGRSNRFVGTLMDITERKWAEKALADLNAQLEERIAQRTAELECSNRALHREIEERSSVEAELRSSKEYLRAVLDTIPGMAWSALPDGFIEYHNRRWLDYTGLSFENAKGWGWVDAIHPDDLEALTAYWQSLLREGSPGEAEARLRRYDGVYRWFLFRTVPVHDESGRLVRWCGSKMDIEDRKLAEDALQTSEDRLREVIDTIPGLVWSSLPDGHIDYLNQRWLDYTGLAASEANGWDWQRAVHPNDLPGLLDYWHSILESGTPGEYEARLRRHDGIYRWFLFRGVPLHNAAGELVKWYGTNTDVEDRRTSELSARGQVEALTHILTAISQEPAPEKFLEHILKMIVKQLGALSLSVWELNENTCQVELLAEYVDARLNLTAPEPAQKSRSGLSLADHPVWTEFFATGEHCVLGQIVDGQSWVRLAGQPQGTFFDWRGQEVDHPKVPDMIARLADLGVTATLCVPLIVAGKVTGFISIRFLEKRDFASEEIALARALAHQAMLAIQLMRLSQDSHRSAVVAERNRLAREIHDTLAQGFTGVIVQLEASEDARSQGLGEMADTHLRLARELAADSLREARRSVRALRPQVLEKQNLCWALSNMISRLLEGTGIQNQFVLHGEAFPLPTEVEDNLLRIGQEVLTNALRHAQATVFQVDLTFSEIGVCLNMHDNGRGFDLAQESEGFGLVGIRERVSSMAGTLIIESKPGQGTRVVIQLPPPHDHVG